MFERPSPPPSDLYPIAVPETREQATLSLLLKNRGLPTWEVPLVAILDVPDPVPVHAWIRRFISNPPDLLVLLTGEGLRRLLPRADDIGMRAEFEAALARVATLCRGPKPQKVLRELGLTATHSASQPTSAGVLETARQLQLKGARVALQLYGQEANVPLQEGLMALGATVDVVAPYVYASKEDELKVVELIERLAAGSVAMLAFTSQSQVKRLQEVAGLHGLQRELHDGLLATPLAAVGPVVGDMLQQSGYPTAVMPERVYFMKPLVTAIERYWQERGGVR